MHRIVGGVAAGDQFLGPAFRIIVDAEQPGPATAEARMVEQREIVEAKLARGFGEQGAQLREVRAGQRGFSEAVAETPSRAGHRKDCFSSMRAKRLPVHRAFSKFL